MILEGPQGSRRVDSAEDLHQALAWRDQRGGARWWLSDEGVAFPCLAVTLTGSAGEVHFFPQAERPGFRCVGGVGLAEGASTPLFYEACDPWEGIDTPNEFILSSPLVGAVAASFLLTRCMSGAVQWLEL